MDLSTSSKSLNLLPLGIPTLIIADDPRLIAAARTTYAHCLAEAPMPNPALELTLRIGIASSSGVSLDVAVEGSRLRLSGRADGFADASCGKASATMSPDLATDPAEFAEVTDTLLLFLLARNGRTPVHAAAFLIGDLAVVLAGPSGSGKSTLALAAANRGFPILSDDTIFVQHDPAFAVWGLPRPMHLYPTDAPPGDHLTRMRNRKLKAAVPLAISAERAQRAVLVLLKRGSGLALSEIEPVDAVEELMRLEPGFDLLEKQSRRALVALASDGAWRLELTDKPADAIDLLATRFAAQN
ncbi:MAG: hypothetical protein V4499_01840 [Pseudomonadota bacterium]